MKKNKKIIIAIISILIFTTGLYGYSQFSKKETISAVLQHRIDLNQPPNTIFAISTVDQTLSNGKNFSKGTRFIGKIADEGGKPVIYFNEIQNSDGTKTNFSAKSNLNLKESDSPVGVSAKLGKTIHRQTKTNVLGAIFSRPNSGQATAEILQRGSALKILVD